MFKFPAILNSHYRDDFEKQPLKNNKVGHSQCSSVLHSKNMVFKLGLTNKKFDMN